MKYLLRLCFIFTCLFTEPSIVLVHLGKSLPPYLPTTIDQIRLFNEECPIYLIANEKAIKQRPSQLDSYHVKYIVAEKLPKNKSHKKFIQKSTLDKSFRDGFWTFTTERFFYLAAFMKQKKLEDVFHIENDVMLYVDLKALLPILKTRYKEMIGATFDNDNRCIPGFLYIPKSEPLEQLISYIAKKAKKGGNDMEFLANFKKKYKNQWIDSLPIFMPDYAKQNKLISSFGDIGTDPEEFSRHFEQFESIFDAAAIGQYLGGMDTFHRANTIGFINESSVFNPSKCQFEWILDEKQRKVPYAIYLGKKWKINNLHIHSKNLIDFTSKPAPQSTQ